MASNSSGEHRGEPERNRLSSALPSSSGESSACVQETEDPTSLQHEFGVRRYALRVELFQQSKQQLEQSSVQLGYSPDWEDQLARLLEPEGFSPGSKGSESASGCSPKSEVLSMHWKYKLKWSKNKPYLDPSPDPKDFPIRFVRVQTQADSWQNFHDQPPSTYVKWLKAAIVERLRCSNKNVSLEGMEQRDRNLLRDIELLNNSSGSTCDLKLRQIGAWGLMDTAEFYRVGIHRPFVCSFRIDECGHNILVRIMADANLVAEAFQGYRIQTELVMLSKQTLCNAQIPVLAATCHIPVAGVRTSLQCGGRRILWLSHDTYISCRAETPPAWALKMLGAVMHVAPPSSMSLGEQSRSERASLLVCSYKCKNSNIHIDSVCEVAEDLTKHGWQSCFRPSAKQMPHLLHAVGCHDESFQLSCDFPDFVHEMRKLPEPPCVDSPINPLSCRLDFIDSPFKLWSDPVPYRDGWARDIAEMLGRDISHESDLIRKRDGSIITYADFLELKEKSESFQSIFPVRVLVQAQGFHGVELYFRQYPSGRTYLAVGFNSDEFMKAFDPQSPYHFDHKSQNLNSSGKGKDAQSSGEDSRKEEAVKAVVAKMLDDLNKHTRSSSADDFSSITLLGFERVNPWLAVFAAAGLSLTIALLVSSLWEQQKQKTRRPDMDEAEDRFAGRSNATRPAGQARILAADEYVDWVPPLTDDNEGQIMPLIEGELTREPTSELVPIAATPQAVTTPAHFGVEVAQSQSIEVLFQLMEAKKQEITTDDYYDGDQRSFFKHIIELITFSVLLEKLTDELIDASKSPGNKNVLKLQFHKLAHRIFNAASDLSRMNPDEAASILKDMRELGHSVQSAEASNWGWVQYETSAKLEDFHYEFVKNSPLEKAAKSLLKAFWAAEPALSSIVDKELALFQAVSTEQIVRGASKTAASVMGTMVRQFVMSIARGS
eukprot:TRINITY_DN10073_c0_g1_i2.p1 TRINITY_DN10073_c0_g1~~TRINITY_DN10073_c0_g1_i2.p1  ORF type:complete len:943 (-),score=110.86 TRINITY_DN10073_c0_g1_i2:81-2909(-)